MAIQTIIDGINKIITSPEANIDGVWRQVNVVLNNIDGVWKESYRRCKVNLYVYGVLYTTIYTYKGGTITLPLVATVYDDDIEHYGWALSSNTTTKDYDINEEVIITDNTNLYAVYSYSEIVQTYTVESALSATTTITIPYNCTVTIGGLKHVVSPDASQAGMFDITLNSSDTAPYCKIGNSYISGTTSGIVGGTEIGKQWYKLKDVSVSAGTTITMLGTYTSGDNSSSGAGGATYQYVVCKYLSGTKDETKYRTTK